MKADIAIITIREDEFEAVFNRLEEYQFKPLKGLISGRRYATFSVPVSDNKVSAVALARSSEQGNDVSQQIASDIIRDFDPQILLVVGIAGGIPHSDFTLGDVIISSRIHNFDVNAINQGKMTFDIRGGIHPMVSDITASLPMYRSILAGWNAASSIGMERPSVDLTQAESNVYGDTEWRKEVLQSLNAQFGKSAHRSQLPLFKIGSITSSNSLMKDTEIPTIWWETVRGMLAIEMESAGVLQAAQQMAKQYPVMAIRGISDIIGLKRDGRWTSYACQTAGAFTYAFIKAGIIEPQESSSSPVSSTSTPSIPTVSSTSTPSTSTARPKPNNSQPTMSIDPTKPAPLDLFISYSEDDEKFKKDLETHLAMLRRDGIIRQWSSGQTEAGLEAEEDISNHIDQSQIILLLISPSFLASTKQYDEEMMRAMERHALGEARVVPILIRSADLGNSPFSKLQSLPRTHQPVDKASNRDEVWSKIAGEIRDICKSLRDSKNQS